jgi:hypothetical protein
LPAEVRRQCGVKPKETGTMQVEGTEIRLHPASSALETPSAGSVPALHAPLTWDEIDLRLKDDRDELLLRDLSIDCCSLGWQSIEPSP